MLRTNSYRAILRSSSIMGAASAVNIANGLVRMKVAAIVLGPAGVGLIGLYQNLVSAAATVAALGVGTVGTRQIANANAQGSATEMATVRQALFWGTLFLAAIGGALFFLLRDLVAERVVGDASRAQEVALLAIGVVLSVAAASQTAVLNGLRRIGDLARVQVLSGLLATVLGCTAMLVWREAAVLALVLGGPFGSCVLASWYVARLGRIEAQRPSMRSLGRQWRVLIGLGVAFMLSGLVSTLALLAVRSIVQRNLGVEGLGFFQACWQISSTYLAVVLGAMATDYYPRLAECVSDHNEVCQLVNEQTTVALLLAGPLVLVLLGIAPWVIRVLYTAEFMIAVDVLRWQLLGDVLKLMSWPLGFVLLAAGYGGTFIITEAIGWTVFIFGTLFLLPSVGIVATGIAFVAMYVAYLTAVFVVVRNRFGFKWPSQTILHAAAVLVAGAAVVLSGQISNFVAAGLGLASATAFAIYGGVKLARMTGLEGRAGWLVERARRCVPVLKRGKGE